MRNDIVKKLSTKDVAYIAGLFDADGCVSVKRYLSRNASYKWDYNVNVSIANSFLPVLEWVKNKIGAGIIREGKMKDAHPKWKPVHQFILHSSQAIQLLEQIDPYLIVKSERAKLTMTLPRIRNVNGNQFAPRTKQQYERQQSVHSMIKDMNVRGVRTVNT